MNILLLGYGKMGRAIEPIALERGHQIAGRINEDNRAELDALATDVVDVVIEFSAPEAAPANLRYCLERGWPVVCGTTGWLAQRGELEALVRQRSGAFFYASNYSIGVNLFFRLNRLLAQFMRNYPSYHVSMTEVHHTEKKDAPSGTAITLADDVVAQNPRLTGWERSGEQAGEPGNVVAIESRREGSVPGTHTVRYDSPTDRIEITHVAHSRVGFALGAVVAAEWLVGRTGVFGMDDLLGE